MQGITWDVALLMVAAIFVAFCVLVRRPTSLASLVSVYMAYVVTLIWGDRIAQLAHGDHLVVGQIVWNFTTSPLTIQLACFLTMLIALTIFMKVGGRKSRYTTSEVVINSLLAVIVAAILALSIMPADARIQLLGGSLVLTRLYDWREWLMALPVLSIIAFGMHHGEE